MDTKIDRKRELRHLYAPGREPVIVEVPEMAFLMIDGSGNPNTSPAFRSAVEALYAVSYGVKFAIKKGPAGADYVVMPLEGLWWMPGHATFSARDKSTWHWTVMIAQPDEATDELVAEATAKAASRKPLPAAPKLRLTRFAEGLATQMLYVGPYADEQPTVDRLLAFVKEQGYEPTGKHHEIYLSDPSRTAPEKMKTVIRHPVA